MRGGKATECGICIWHMLARCIRFWITWVAEVVVKNLGLLVGYVLFEGGCLSNTNDVVLDVPKGYAIRARMICGRRYKHVRLRRPRGARVICKGLAWAWCFGICVWLCRLCGLFCNSLNGLFGKVGLYDRTVARGLPDDGVPPRDYTRTHNQTCASGRGRWPHAYKGKRRTWLSWKAVVGTACLIIAIGAYSATRIGEAKNPGPSGGHEVADSVTAHGECRVVHGPALVPDKRPSAVVFPSDDKPGLRRTLAPGLADSCVARDLRSAVQDEFALCVESVNGTGFTAVRKRLECTEAHVLCAQETWVTAADVSKWSAWARLKGWKSVWAPAVRSKEASRGASGGVAIFARVECGLRCPSRHGRVWVDSRVAAAVVEAPGHRPILVASLYGKTGGWNSVTHDIVRRVHRNFRDQDDVNLLLAAGDFHCDPRLLAKECKDELVESVVVSTTTRAGTFRRPGKKGSTIDYFVLSDRLAKLIGTVRTVEPTGGDLTTVKGHVPVSLRFFAQATAWRALHIRAPQALPIERLVGPVQGPPDYSCVAEWTLKARRAAMDRDRAGVQKCLDIAYEKWAAVAEAEISLITGKELAKYGLRGALPKLAWRSVLPEKNERTKGVDQTVPRVAVLVECSRLLDEVLYLGGGANDDQDNNNDSGELRELLKA